jgi:hypothetical protein
MESKTQITPEFETKKTSQEITQTIVQNPNNTKQKSFLFISLTILVLILLGTTGFFAYQNYQLKQQIAEKMALLDVKSGKIDQMEIADPTSTADPTADWKIYTNDKYGFTFKYPNDWEYQENYSKTQNTIDYLQITLAKSEYFNPIPKGNPLIMLSLIETTDQNKLSIYQNTEIVKTIVIGEITAEERKHMTPTVDSKYVTFINNDISYEIESQMHTQSIEHQEVFDQILSTFKFTDYSNQNENDRVIGRINKAYYNNNIPYIDVDLIEWINDDSAPNGFRIENESPLVKSFEVLSTAPIYLIDFTDAVMSNSLVDFDELINASNNTSPNYSFGPGIPPFWIYLNNQDQVYKIEQQYTP